jgi:hypothetical protein
MRGPAFVLGALLLACSTSPEQSAFRVLENEHFVLFAQPDEPDARATFLALERQRAAIEAAVGIRPPRRPRLRVVLLAGPRTAGGMLDGAWGEGFVAKLEGGDVLVTSLGRPHLARLYVEATLAGRAPYWYAQGMADLLSTLRVHDGSVTIGLPPRGWSRARPRPPADDEEKERGGGKETVTGTQLVTDEAFKPGVEKRRRDHWMLAHFLLLASAERERGLREYIRLWQLGVPSPEAFERAIGRSADDLYRGEVARYAERGFRARTFPLVGSSPDEDVKARPADAAELHALLAAVRAWQARHAAPGAGAR